MLITAYFPPTTTTDDGDQDSSETRTSSQFNLAVVVNSGDRFQNNGLTEIFPCPDDRGHLALQRICCHAAGTTPICLGNAGGEEYLDLCVLYNVGLMLQEANITGFFRELPYRTPPFTPQWAACYLVFTTLSIAWTS